MPVLAENNGELPSSRTTPPVAYLSHDHREGKNVRLLGIFPPVQDLRRSPSRGAVVIRYAPHGVQVFYDGSEAKVHDACITGVVNEDVLLASVNMGVK